MALAQWLTPTLVATYPGFEWIVRVLVVIAVVEIVGGIGFGVVVARAAPRLDSSSAAGVRNMARRLTKARTAILALTLANVVLWVVESAVFGLSAQRNELLLVITLGLVMVPACVLLSIFASAMRRSADSAARSGDIRAG